VKVVFAFGVSQVHHPAVNPPDRVKTKLAVGNPLVFINPDRPVEDTLAAQKVEAMLANV
jgi:hypothetical protein